MSTELSHLIAGILVTLVGILALATPVYKDFKEQDPEIRHLKVKTLLIAIVTVLVGLLIAANRIDDVLNWIRGLGSMLSGTPS